MAASCQVQQPCNNYVKQKVDAVLIKKNYEPGNKNSVLILTGW